MSGGKIDPCQRRCLFVFGLRPVHNIPVDYIVTPEEIVFTEHDRRKPEGIYWELLEQKKLRSIPMLRKLRGES